MKIALQKHSAHINILLNPDEYLRKRITFRCTGADAQNPVAQVVELAKSGAPYFQIRMDAAWRCPHAAYSSWITGYPELIYEPIAVSGLPTIRELSRALLDSHLR